MANKRLILSLLPLGRSSRPSLPFLWRASPRQIWTQQAFRCANASKTPTTVTPIPTTIGLQFINGFFRFKVDQNQYIISYWTPVQALAGLVSEPASGPEPVPESAPEPRAKPGAEPGTGAAIGSGTVVAEPVAEGLVTVIDAKKRKLFVPNSTALGPLLSQKKSLLVEVDASNSFLFSFDGLHKVLKQYEASVKLREAQEDDKENETVVSSYLPLSQDFESMLIMAETQANKRFKWGGLFLLSAQLGFVARLTWFEYSWDIMEPITWCLTYSMMLGTFAYYILTSQEFMLPAVERRLRQDRFWRLAKNKQFNVIEFKRLREQLLQLQERAMRSKIIGSNRSMSNQ